VPGIVKLKKLATGVNLVKWNSPKSITKICTFGSGKRLFLLDKMGKFDTIAEVNHYAALMVTIHIVFMQYLIACSSLLIDTSEERYAL